MITTHISAHGRMSNWGFVVPNEIEIYILTPIGSILSNAHVIQIQEEDG